MRYSWPELADKKPDAAFLEKPDLFINSDLVEAQD